MESFVNICFCLEEQVRVRSVPSALTTQIKAQDNVRTVYLKSLSSLATSLTHLFIQSTTLQQGELLNCWS